MHRPTPETSTPREGEPGGRRAAGAGWAILLASLALILAFGTAPERSMFWDAVFDAGHAPLFGLAALAVLGMLRARTPGTPGPGIRRRAFLLTVALGAVTEALQVFQSSREPSLGDFLRDVAGAAAFLLLSGARERPSTVAGPRSAGRVRALAALAGALLLVAAAAHLGMTAAAYAARDRAMPTLMAFDGAWWERRFVEPGDGVLTARVRPPGLEAAFDEPLARLDLNPAEYPGVGIVEPHPDWSGHRRLVFTIVSDLEAPLPLVIRVHDAAHDQRYEDRFNLALRVAPGVNRFSIPLDRIRRAPDRREMDMRRIRGVMLFAHRLTRPARVYLGAFRLE